MEKHLVKLYAFVHEALLSLNTSAESLQNHLSNYAEISNKNSQKNNAIEKYEILTDGLHYLLEQICLSSETPVYEEMTDQFKPVIEYLADHEKLVVKEQKKERFYAQPEDTRILKVRKLFKRFRLKLGWLIIRFINVFRKKKRPLSFWNHKINEQHLANYFYRYKFHSDFISHFNDFLNKRFSLLLDLNKFDNAFEKKILEISDADEIDPAIIQSYADSMKSLANQLETGIARIETKLRSEFKNSLQIAGTIEFPTSGYKYGKINRKTSKLIKKYQKQLINHHIAEQAIYEYWLFETGIRASVLDMNKFIDHSISTFKGRVDSEIVPDLENLISGIDGALGIIEKQSFKSSVLAELTNQISSLKSNLLKSIERASQSELLPLYESFYPSMIQSLKSVPDLSHFASGVFKAKRIRKKYLLKPVKARAFLEGILENTIQDTFISEGKKLQRKIMQLQIDLEEILQVIEVSYDYYGPKGDTFPETDRKELSEGLKRSKRKTNDFKTDLVELIDYTYSLFLELNRKFQAEIMVSLEPRELIKTDRKRRLKATWRFSRRKSADSISRFYKSIQNALRWSKNSYKTIKNKYFNLRSLLGISEQKEILSSEISNYLAETEKVISQLPPMYQRLYAIKPLAEERFFVKRVQAYTEIEKSFKNWQNYKFAPACLIGEQGSGATTFLNFFEKDLGTNYKVIRLDLNTRYITESDFNTLINKLFPELKYSTLEELTEKLNENKQHRVVILENIQHLFMRKMYGFNNLSRLFQLISQSNPGVFWLCTCLQYSWKYLDNSHQISDYFAHVIHLENLTVETLTEAILRRHNPSGFELCFLPSEEYKRTRFFLRSNKTDKQLILQKEYFNALKEATKGNLSSAFLWWLRSVEKVEDNTIYFRFHKLNHGFLHSLPTNKITSLYAILIHSGLTCEEHASIFNCSLKESYILLMVMTDDGILSKSGEKYMLNPMLYRHIVSHLEAANFIQ